MQKEAKPSKETKLELFKKFVGFLKRSGKKAPELTELTAQQLKNKAKAAKNKAKASKNKKNTKGPSASKPDKKGDNPELSSWDKKKLRNAEAAKERASKKFAPKTKEEYEEAKKKEAEFKQWRADRLKASKEPAPKRSLKDSIKDSLPEIPDNAKSLAITMGGLSTIAGGSALLNKKEDGVVDNEPRESKKKKEEKPKDKLRETLKAKLKEPYKKITTPKTVKKITTPKKVKKTTTPSIVKEPPPSSSKEKTKEDSELKPWQKTLFAGGAGGLVGGTASSLLGGDVSTNVKTGLTTAALAALAEQAHRKKWLG